MDSRFIPLPRIGCCLAMVTYCLSVAGQGAFWQPLGISSIQLQKNGKVVLAGVFSAFTGFEGKRIIRLNADGSFDESFNPPELKFEAVNAILVQPDDKVLVAGWSSNGIIRLNVDGTLDQSFQLEPFQNTWGIWGMQGIARQSDGKIIAFGQFDKFRETAVSGFARFNT